MQLRQGVEKKKKKIKKKKLPRTSEIHKQISEIKAGAT